MVFRPKPLDDFHPFNKTMESPRFRQIEGVELIVSIAQTKGAERIPVINHVEACQLARHGDGMAQTEQHHGGADGAPFHFRAKTGESRHLVETLETRDVGVIAHRKRVEADPIGCTHLLDQRWHQPPSGLFN
jgi:hypothetical protein